MSLSGDLIYFFFVPRRYTALGPNHSSCKWKAGAVNGQGKCARGGEGGVNRQSTKKLPDAADTTAADFCFRGFFAVMPRHFHKPRIQNPSQAAADKRLATDRGKHAHAA